MTAIDESSESNDASTIQSEYVPELISPQDGGKHALYKYAVTAIDMHGITQQCK
jgi:hypothetical protein